MGPSTKELDGASICIPAGSRMDPVADFFRRNTIKVTPILIEQQNEATQAYLSGRCDTFATDLSSLAAFRYSLDPKAAEHVLLPDILAKEPLGLVVRQGDNHGGLHSSPPFRSVSRPAASRSTPARRVRVLAKHRAIKCYGCVDGPARAGE